MKRKFLIWLQERIMARSRTPWACFETNGPTSDGRVGFSMSWNKAFITNLHRQEIQAETEEATVQLFFLGMHMLPEELAGDVDIINPEATPNLTSEANRFRS